MPGGDTASPASDRGTTRHNRTHCETGDVCHSPSLAAARSSTCTPPRRYHMRRSIYILFTASQSRRYSLKLRKYASSVVEGLHVSSLPPNHVLNVKASGNTSSLAR